MPPKSPTNKSADSRAAMDLQMLALFSLVTVAAGGVVWVFVYPILSGERQAEKRVDSVARQAPVVRATAQRGAQRSRREQVEESLKELELRRSKAKNLPLAMRINQAGLNWSKRQFILISAALGVVTFAAAFVVEAGPLPAAPPGFAAPLRAPPRLPSPLPKRPG